jgi:hypothetical protein
MGDSGRWLYRGGGCDAFLENLHFDGRGRSRIDDCGMGGGMGGIMWVKERGCGMSVAYDVMMFVSLVAGSVFLIIVGYMLFKVYRKKWLMKSVLNIIGQYRMKLTGQNRFVMNYEILKKMYPEYDDFDVYTMFCELVEQGHIKRDPLDGEYIIN